MTTKERALLSDLYDLHEVAGVHPTVRQLRDDHDDATIVAAVIDGYAQLHPPRGGAFLIPTPLGREYVRNSRARSSKRKAAKK